jgi:hypothetical protein
MGRVSQVGLHLYRGDVVKLTMPLKCQQQVLGHEMPCGCLDDRTMAACGPARYARLTWSSPPRARFHPGFSRTS